MALFNIPSCLVFNQLFIFFLLLLPNAMSISFEFPSFSTNNINLTLQGDAFTNPDGLQLTKDTRGSSIGGSVGRALYHERVHLWDNSTGKPKVIDFTTHFSFIITSVEKSSADGFTFFITPFNSNIPNNSAGGFLGLFCNESAINGTQNQIFAVEFDTYRNPWDPSDNHAGIDVDSIVSKANVTLQTSIKKGSKAYAWVSYNSTTQNLSVFLTFADILVFNGNSSLSYIVDLKTILPEWVGVGFSGATGVVTELHTILSWSFSSTLGAGDGFPQPNKTGDGLTQTNNTGSGSTKGKLGLIIGLAVSSGVVSCAIGLLWFICWRKRIGGNTKDLGDDDYIDDEFEKGTGPRRFTYRELIHAKNNFTGGGKLGEGGFGGVYKELLSESNIEVAVKRVSKGSKQGKKEYIS